MLFQDIWRSMVKKNKNKKEETEQEKAKCAFQIAVENTPDVKNGFCVGLKGVKNSDRNKVNVTDPRKLQGSLDIDTQVQKKYPQEPRWDYALSYDDKLYFFEVHPASTSEVDTVINKLTWLKKWLKNKAPQINKLQKGNQPYTWVPTGRYAILSLGTYAKKLAVSGIKVANSLKL